MLSPPPGWLKLTIPGTSTVRRPAAAGRELPSGEPGDRHRLRSVTAGAQGYEPSVPERQHVDVAIVGLPYPQSIEPRRVGDDHDLLGEACERHSAPDFVRGLDDEPELRELLVVGERVAVDRRGEAALRREAEPLERDEAACLVDPPLEPSAYRS